MDLRDEIEDREIRVVYLCITLMICSVLVFLISIMNFDINSFHGALIMLSILVFFSSSAVAVMFKKRSDALKKAVNEGRYLAYFSYSGEEWEKYVCHEHGFRMEENKSKFKLLFIIIVPIFSVFILLIDDARLEMFMVMAGLLVFLAFFAFFIPAASYHARGKSGGKVLVMEKAVLINNRFHSWDFPLSRLTQVKILEKPYRHIKITYGFWDRLGPRSYTVNIPIFSGRKWQANRIVTGLKSVNPLVKP